MINVFIGYDEGEKIAYHTLCESIRAKSSVPVSFTPLDLQTIKNIFTREKQSNQSTDFAFNRFLVPYLSNYKGWSLFMDCDMLMRTDINLLWQHIDEKYAVMVCKHDYIPNQNTKFRGAKNEPFPKKNWSSFMLMNNKKCKALTPEYVNTATGLELHQFKWLKNENLIGSLPLEWNWLVGEYPFNDKVYNVHYTLGGPYFNDYNTCEYANEWFNTYLKMVKINL
jgi:lipopolysaccharide biosynthesis glycosyltransferase